MVWNAFHRVAVCYILESWFSGTVSGVWLLLGCDLSQAPHHLSFSSHCLFLEPGPPAFPFALELADIFSVHIFSVTLTRFGFYCLQPRILIDAHAEQHDFTPNTTELTSFQPDQETVFICNFNRLRVHFLCA